MSSKSVSKDEMFRADDQNSEEKSDKFKITDNHLDETYSSNCEQCIREKDIDGDEEIKFTIKQMKSEKIPDSTVQNHNLFCPSKQIKDSFHDAGKSEVKDNCSSKQFDMREVVTEIIPCRNIVVVEVYQCKYCKEESNDKDSLITPCRCSGSIGYVHKHCLENWIRVRSEGSSETKPRCELCGYRFYHQKQYKWTPCSCPELNRSDRWLYAVGIICVFIVIGCLSALVLCFIQDDSFKKNYLESKIDTLVASSVNSNEINRAMETYSFSTLDKIKIVCAVVSIVFATFCVFLAKLCKVPPHKFIFRYIHSNEQWTTLPYSASRDSLVMANATNV